MTVLVAALAGWILGASGRSEIDQERRAAVQRADLLEAKAAILDGQVQIFLVNFGEASRRFGLAQEAIARVQTALRETGQAERAGRLEIPLSHLKDAQRLAGLLDPSARSAAEEALQALGSISVDRTIE